jgi:hypothetical protein
LLVVPKGLEMEVISLNHEPIYASHPGKKRTLDLLRLHYCWPGMSKKVDQFVWKCDSCQRRKSGTEFRAPLGAVRQQSQLFQYCHMDLVGSFTVSQKKNRYILTFIDQLTKYVEQKPYQTRRRSCVQGHMPLK